MAMTISDIMSNVDIPLEIPTDAKRIYNPLDGVVEYYMKSGHIKFLKQLLVNDHNRTPLTKDDIHNIERCLTQGYYTDTERNLFRELKIKYKDHVWGTHV